MRIADTSVLYAAFVAEDAHHRRALLALGDPEPIAIPSEIFSETIALLQYRHGFAQSAQAGAAIRQTPHISIAPATGRIHEDAWDTFERASGRLSYPDALVVAHCRDAHATPLTFDPALKAAARR